MFKTGLVLKQNNKYINYIIIYICFNTKPVLSISGVLISKNKHWD